MLAIRVVNMTPLTMSGENNQDSEPSLNVNPANPQQIAATAFTPIPGGNAPIYVSLDGGENWTLWPVIPSPGGYGQMLDSTVRFSPSGILYIAAILDEFDGLNPTGRLGLFRVSPPPFQQLDSRKGIDQPFLTVSYTASEGIFSNALDRLYVGCNDLSAWNGKSSSVDQGANPVPGYWPVFGRQFGMTHLETRWVAGQDGPQARVAVDAYGTVYAAYYGWRQPTQSGYITDVVLARDDYWGSGSLSWFLFPPQRTYGNLIDPIDREPGLRVAKEVAIPYSDTTAYLGQERFGGDLSIAVDPRIFPIGFGFPPPPHQVPPVYLAWADLQGVRGDTYTLHVRASGNRGQTWTPDLFTVPNGKNPALAVNALGQIGFLYQQVTGSAPNLRWETHFAISNNGEAWEDFPLATTPADQPPIEVTNWILWTTDHFPYIGDYIDLQAVGNDFYGAYCANNTPDLANFPLTNSNRASFSLRYQRVADFQTKTLLALDGTTAVPISIDPFFVKITNTVSLR